MKVLFVEGYPGFRGAQRSLAALAGRLREEVEVEIVCTVRGRALAAYAAEGLPVRLLEVPPVLRIFGGELLRRGIAGRVDAVIRGLSPFTLRWNRYLRRERVITVCTVPIRTAASRSAWLANRTLATMRPATGSTSSMARLRVDSSARSCSKTRLRGARKTRISCVYGDGGR